MRGVSFELAQSLIQACLSCAKKMHLPPLSIVILDNGGHVKSAVSQDGVGTMRFEIARGKAAAALGMGMGTRQLFELFERGVLPDRFATSLNGVANGDFVPQPGGLLILDEGNVLGAVGVSGASSEQDEALAKNAAPELGVELW